MSTLRFPFLIIIEDKLLFYDSVLDRFVKWVLVCRSCIISVLTLDPSDRGRRPENRDVMYRGN